MSVSVSDFLAAVQDIRSVSPKYKKGHVGKDGYCDCIGLIMGAMYRCKHQPYTIHGSNYFYRNEMSSKGEISGAFFPGEVVYKRCPPGQSGYGLPERYASGGEFYDGDLNDYYHVGVVISANPLQIMHCTKSGTVDGITVDTKQGKWLYGGRLKDIDYDGSEKEVNVSLYDAQVVVDTGTSLNLREKPSTAAKLVAKITAGDAVQVLEETNTEWANVFYNGMQGYVMRKFLVKMGAVSAYQVVIPCASEAMANAIRDAIVQATVSAV